MANRTLEFYGYAYGNTPVQLNAHINGTTVFSGAVTTLNEPFPATGPDMTSAPILFTADSGLFPDTLEGSYPMTLSVATGDGVAVANVLCNYMAFSEFEPAWESTDATLTGNILTPGNVTSGTVAIGQQLLGNGIDPTGHDVNIKSGPNPDGTWLCDWMIPNGATEVWGGGLVNYAGNATAFYSAYNGTPTNTDNIADPRSSVTIDGVPQNPDRGSNTGTWTWLVAQGSTLSCNLNVSLGNSVA
jgi:uncharacterized membrane protein